MTRTIETTGVVQPDHTITLKLPDDFPPGECHVVVMSERGSVDRSRPLTGDWEMIEAQSWPESLTMSREQIYGNE